uniref:C-type lectin domain-containing protein n=2 Tax=Poecilia reticulata TaxID=8081 RepID=A0A3P9PTQ8_POERE
MDKNKSTEAIYENPQELEEGKKEKPSCSFQLLSLGILSVLLLASIAFIAWISVDMMSHKEKLDGLKRENKRLNIKKSLLENVTEQLIGERDDLKRALQVILMHDNFPVNQFCPDKKCLPCQKSWASLLEKCDQFYDQHSGQNPGKGARLYCQNTSADLVVVDDVKEQSPASNHEMNFCLLGQTDNNWLWIDGQNESLG